MNRRSQLPTAVRAPSKIDLPEEYAPLVINALEHYYALTRARQHEDVRYQQAADWFKRKRPATEEPVHPAKKAGSRRRSG